jgi:hypothetical protein
VRLTGRHVVIAALLVALASIAILSSSSGPSHSRTELLPGIDLFGESAASSAAELRQTPAYNPGAEALVVIQGLTARRLVLWPLDGSTPPQEIDHHIDIYALQPLLPSPDGTRVLYGTEHTVMVLDVHARRSIIVGLLPANSNLLYAQWSPDSRAIAFVVQTPLRLVSYYTLADGTVDAQGMLDVPYGLSLDVGWLPDYTPVSMTLCVGIRGGLETLYYRFDPASGITENLTDVLTENLVDAAPTPPLTVIQPWSPRRSPGGMLQVYAAKSWEETRYQGTCRTGPLAISDNTWLAQTLRTVNYQDQIAFEIDGLYMDHPTWLDDGQIVFRAIADPICTDLESGFYLTTLGQTPIQIIHAEPEYISDEENKLLFTSTYALSPDQSRIAWIYNDITSARSIAYALPLDDPVNASPEALLETGMPSADVPFAFQDEEMILYFAWLP